MNAAIARVTLQRAVLEQLVDDRGAPVGRQSRVRERHAQLVVALDDPREAEELVFDLAEVLFGLRDLEQRLRVRVDAVGHRTSYSPPPGR